MHGIKGTAVEGGCKLKIVNCSLSRPKQGTLGHMPTFTLNLAGSALCVVTGQDQPLARERNSGQSVREMKLRRETCVQPTWSQSTKEVHRRPRLEFSLAPRLVVKRGTKWAASTVNKYRGSWTIQT